MIIIKVKQCQLLKENLETLPFWHPLSDGGCAFHFAEIQSVNCLYLRNNLDFVSPFVPNAPFLCPLKTFENLMFSWSRERVEQIG